ncbi:MAG: hypothetical protein NUV77_07895 [Thermoguttaceae bacterium]|jgi:hypothetical protein|nr:hypothetical protein [Thermoguttaceae bacterium]
MGRTPRQRVLDQRAIAFGRLGPALVVAAFLGVADSGSGETPPNVLKTEHFDRDPGWEGFNNRIAPKATKTVRQDFGYSPTHFAGKEKGEIGGTIWRGSAHASYAARIPVRTLNDKLSASGSFALTASSGSSGVFFGWFRGDRPGGGRQNSLGFRFAGEGAGARITLQLVTATNQACGTKVTPWIVDKTKPPGQGRKYRPPSIKNDGTRYAWTLDYDPLAADGNGQFRCTVRSNSPKPEEFETKTFTVTLPKGYKEQGTTFDRFGLMNSERPGNALTIYFDDLRHDGQVIDFARDPGWEGVGNRATYERREEGGAHDFGYSAPTRHAGGTPGELGGTLWRSGVYGYYADRVGPFSLADRLEAQGKVVLTVGPPDSGMYFGWFHSAHKENAPTQAGDFVGVRIGGPTRVGHYFVPAYATSRAAPRPPSDAREHPPRVTVEAGAGPVLVPQRVVPWRLVYDPDAAGGRGAIEATLGDQTVALALKPGDKAKGATLDRFGLFTTHIGGSFLKVYFDDLTYTAARPVRQTGVPRAIERLGLAMRALEFGTCRELRSSCSNIWKGDGQHEPTTPW